MRWTGHAWLLVAVVLLVTGASLTKVAIGRIQGLLGAPADVLVISSTNEEPRHVLSATGNERLEGPVLRLEIPRNEDEFLSLTPASTRPLWRYVMWIDLVFITGYVLLFLYLPFGRPGTTLWEHPGFLAILTAWADVLENGGILWLLALSDAGQQAGSSFGLVIASLKIVGALKWLFFFMTCRALGIDFEERSHWRWIAVWLRAASMAGSWAALLALIGLPARPLLTLMFIVSGLLLLISAVQRLRNVSGDSIDTKPPEEEAFVVATA